MSTKGQLIIPKTLRDRHGWGPGSEIEIEDTPGGVVLRELQRDLPRTTIADLAGCAGYKGPRRSLDEMDAGMARAVRDDWRQEQDRRGGPQRRS